MYTTTIQEVESNNGQVLTFTIRKNKPSEKGLEQLAKKLIELARREIKAGC